MNTAKINFVGDIALFRRYQQQNIDPFKNLDLPLADYNIGNLEFPVHKNRSKYFHDIPDDNSVYFDYFKKTEFNKFNLFSLANNHIMDYGTSGIEDIIEVLKLKNVDYTGITTDESIASFEFLINDIKFCLIAFVKNGRWHVKESDYKVNSYNVSKIVEKIQIAKQGCDHVLVYPHWGTELVDIPETNDILNARLFIDSGASLVVGHHPHVMQGMETYKGGIIAYSLGSFIYLSEDELAYSAKINKNRDFSMCLNIEFDKNQIICNKQYFYICNLDQMTPSVIKDNFEHFKHLCKNIENSNIRDLQKRQLAKREIASMIIRFKKRPFRSFLHYSQYAIKLLKRVLLKK